MIKIGMMFSDRYEILEKIGTGGMSDVYKAKDHKLNRAVAVKVLKQEFSENANFVSKFRTEAQAAAGLMHSNIVNVYDVGEEDGIYYIVMELVEGMTLKKYIEKKSRLTVKEAVSIAIQVCLGIEAAHSNNIIHRDIKPQNIMISKEGRVKVTDFGIAKAATSNTISSNVMGSVHYTSPEQARGGYSDAKSDIYSLGITLFEMLTGRVPFNGDTTVSIAIKHIQDQMPSPREYAPDVPVSVEMIVMKCTQKSPDYRYQNMSELIEDLKQSLITPDEDFVVIQTPEIDGATRMSDRDVSEVRSKTERLRTVSPEVSRSEVPQRESEPEFVYTGKNRNQQPSQRIPQKQLQAQQRPQGQAPVRQSQTRTQTSSRGMRVANQEEKEEKNPVMEKITTVLMIVIAVVVAVGALIIIANVFDVFPLGHKDDAQETEVTEQQQPPVDNQGDNSQSNAPASGTVQVPDVSADHSLTQAEATKRLADMGLLVDVQKSSSEEVEKGKVISQTPQAGQEVKVGSTVTLLISDGSGVETVEVPNLLGETRDSAELALEAVGLTLGNVEEGYSDEYAPGLVFYQSYTSGGNVSVGTVVDIRISKGAKPRAYSCNMIVEAPNDPEYSGTEAVVTLYGTDNSVIYRTNTNVFPVTINVNGIQNMSSGAIVINYTVSVTTETYDEAGNPVPTTTTEQRATTQAVVFTEDN